MKPAFKSQFDLHTRLFNNVLEGIAEHQATQRASDTVNHMTWIAGHLTYSRNGMHFIRGKQVDAFYPEFFDRGTRLEPEASYPALQEIKLKWNSISELISPALNNLKRDFLGKQAPFQTPISNIDPSVLGFLGFLMSHEAYHIGQLGILRKYVGAEAMSYE